MKELMNRMFVNPLRLAFKMFLLVWIVLFLNIFLKVTFNYWQPYVIPTDSLELVGNYIDSHRWLEIILNGVFYVINGVLVLLCCLRQWWFKDKKEMIIIVSLIIIGYIFVSLGFSTITTLILSIILPLVLKPKNWLWVILTFIISNVFMILSFSLEDLVNSNYENFIIHTFMQFDYYIMLVLNYILFNLLRIKKEMKNNGRQIFLSWFGGKKLDELYAIKEKEWDSLTEEQREELDKVIALKEGK